MFNIYDDDLGEKSHEKKSLDPIIGNIVSIRTLLKRQDLLNYDLVYTILRTECVVILNIPVHYILILKFNIFVV